nr:unnamed protein product [Naegleria fowleri]
MSSHCTHNLTSEEHSQCPHSHHNHHHHGNDLSVAELNSKTFDQMALNWDTNPSKAEFSRRVAHGIRDVFRGVLEKMNQKQDLLIMDFGCGTGTLSLLFLNEFKEYIKRIDAVDVSEGMISQLKEKKSKLIQEGLLEGDDKIISHVIDLALAETVNHPIVENKGKCNVIISGMVFHHLENVPEKMKLLASYLAPGGVLIFTDLDKDQEHSDKFHCKHMTHEVPYKGGFSSNEISQWLKEAHFVDEEFSRNVTTSKKGNDGIEREFILMTTSASKH